MPHHHDPRSVQLRRLEELRERQARLAAMRAQQHTTRLPGHGHRTHRGK